MKNATINFKNQLSWIESFVQKTNTSASDWQQYNVFAKSIGDSFPTLTIEEKSQVKKAYGEVMTPQTLQGHVLEKPHGYAGDYEIIEKFYTFHTSPDERLAKWDNYLHTFPAVKAVRNRKAYIKNILAEKMKNHSAAKSFEMLNLASGPARDLYEFFTENPTANMNVECIDLDQDAINYATNLLGEHSSKVTFLNKNILRFATDKQYDLVWSAGLFDYFNDDVFKRLLTRFLANVAQGGELVIGNFCKTNPNMAYMELLEWNLHHRTAEDLINLAENCGVARENCVVEKEPEGVNLFIRIRC